MAKPTVKSVAAPEFPPLCCGACHYSQPIEKEDHFMCFVNPPTLVVGDDPYWIRGCPVEPNEPECEKFQPRCHS